MSEQSLLLQYWLDAEQCCFCAPQVDQNNYPDKRTVNKIEVRAAAGVQAGERLHVSRAIKSDDCIMNLGPRCTMLHASASSVCSC